MRLPGMKVSDLLKAADDYGMWDSSGAEFLNKVKELTAGTKLSFAEKCMGATPSEYVFVSWSHDAECGLGAAIALVADMLEPDDHVFIDILCFPHNENDPKFYEGIYSVFMDALSQCRCILMPCTLDDATLQMSPSEIRAIRSWKEAHPLRMCPKCDIIRPL